MLLRFYMHYSLTLLQLRGEQVGNHCSRQTPPCSVQGWQQHSGRWQPLSHNFLTSLQYQSNIRIIATHVVQLQHCMFAYLTRQWAHKVVQHTKVTVADFTAETVYKARQQSLRSGYILYHAFSALQAITPGHTASFAIVFCTGHHQAAMLQPLRTCV